MTLEQIIKEKLDRLNEIPDRLITAVEKVQREQYIKLLELLNALDRSGDDITRSRKNLLAIDVIIVGLQASFINENAEIITAYEKAVRDFVGEMKKQQVLTESYFAKVFPGAAPDVQFSQAVALQSRLTASNALLGSATDAAFFDPIREGLNNAISSGASYRETVDFLKQIIIGDPEKEGVLKSHIKQIAHDTFAVSDRAYTDALSSDMGVEWYRWAGVNIPTSTEFCDERHNQYFHRKEIEAWGAGHKTVGMEWPKGGTWAGKAQGLNSSTIFQWGHGYNCRRSILPVSIRRVPAQAVQRAIEQGFYVPVEA